MSRVGKMPIPVPKGAEVKIGANQITVKGPLGYAVPGDERRQLDIVREGEALQIKPAKTTRARRTR